MSNYSELSIASADLLGTGSSDYPKSLGADIKFFLAESSFTGTAAQLKSQSYWEAAIVAKTVIPFPKVMEIEQQNVDASYKETSSGDTFKTKGEKRKTGYQFIESVVVHSGMKSHSDRGWNIWYYTENGYLRCHTKSTASGVYTFEGLKASRFYVNAQSTNTFSEPSFTPIVIESDDVDDWDKEFGIIQPDFNMMDLVGVKQADIQVQSVTTGATLVVSVKVKERGTNIDITGIAAAKFTLLDSAGAAITITSATETANVYAITATSTETTGHVSTAGVITISSINYEGAKVAFA